MNHEATTSVDDWATRAADLILEDLKGRKGVGNELDNVDADILFEIQETMAEIMRNSAGVTSPSEQPDLQPHPAKQAKVKPDNRIREAIEIFSTSMSQPMDEFELKDAFVDLVEGVLATNARKMYVVAQPTGELEVRASVNRKVHTLYTAGNHDALSALCATIVAAGQKRMPYLPSRPFESIITRDSIDQHGLRFPKQLKTIHAMIEPLNKGMFIDLLLEFKEVETSTASQAADGDIDLNQ
jgi:hypothetical protein